MTHMKLRDSYCIELLPRIAFFRWFKLNNDKHWYTVVFSWLVWSAELNLGEVE